jgi:hypothetical protein
MAAPAGSNRLAAMVMIDHRPQEQPDIPASEQLTVAKGELVEVLHRNFETQWWDCRLAVPALAGVKWSSETHTRTGRLPSGCIQVSLALAENFRTDPSGRPPLTVRCRFCCASQVLGNYVDVDVVAQYANSEEVIT